MIKFYFVFISGLFVGTSLSAQNNTFPGSGNVGIGTTNPLGALDVKGVSSWGTVKIFPTTDNAENGIGFSSRALESDYSRMWFTGIGGWNNGQNFVIGSALHGGPSVTFLETGNVGIGTTSPDDLLDTKGAALFGPLTERLSLGSGSFGFNRRVANGQIFDTGQFAYQMQHTGNSTQGNDYLAFQVYNPNSSQVTPYALAINSTGNVGIGTPNPDARLAVNGTVHAKEIRVDLNVPGADFVFEKGYSLKPLLTVNKYIGLNHHLPDMPSAKSMEKNGIDVSEMNMKLLQKVEELTLYLIDQQKQLATQHKQIHDLQKKLNQKAIR